MPPHGWQLLVCPLLTTKDCVQGIVRHAVFTLHINYYGHCDGTKYRTDNKPAYHVFRTLQYLTRFIMNGGLKEKRPTYQTRYMSQQSNN